MGWLLVVVLFSGWVLKKKSFPEFQNAKFPHKIVALEGHGDELRVVAALHWSYGSYWHTEMLT